MRLYFLTQSLIENFTHLGFHKATTNHAYRFYLHGSYSNISIINPALTVFALRKITLIFLRTLLRRYKMCFITPKIPPRLKGNNLFFNQQYVLDYWVPGTISNRRFSCLYGVRTSRSYLRRRVPAVILIVGLTQKKTFDIYKETRKRGLICIPLLDSDTEPSFYSYFIPTNTKSVAALYFFLDFFSDMCSYSRLLGKKYFARNVFKKKKI